MYDGASLRVDARQWLRTYSGQRPGKTSGAYNRSPYGSSAADLWRRCRPHACPEPGGRWVRGRRVVTVSAMSASLKAATARWTRRSIVMRLAGTLSGRRPWWPSGLDAACSCSARQRRHALCVYFQYAFDTPACTCDGAAQRYARPTPGSSSAVPDGPSRCAQPSWTPAGTRRQERRFTAGSNPLCHAGSVDVTGADQLVRRPNLAAGPGVSRYGRAGGRVASVPYPSCLC
jgi:hypothetical protein